MTILKKSSKVRIAVMLSGKGTTFEALQNAIKRDDIPAEIEVVISNNPDAFGVKRAQKFGLPVEVISHKNFSSREEHERAIIDVLNVYKVEWICLAGYMRILTRFFVDKYYLRILNTHPSLLPAFPGVDAPRQALEYGAKITGCTIHFVDYGVDTGPIVLQRCVPVYDNDTVESLTKRIQEQEYIAYPEALHKLLTKRWELRGRRVVFY